MATQLDVARKARVSYMTVSRVVNNLPNVKPETRERVLKAIRELSYVPNAAARILSGKRTDNVGIIFPHEEYIVARPYFIELSVKLEQRLSEHGYHLFLGSIRKDGSGSEFRQLIGEKKVDGLIYFAPPIDDLGVKALIVDRVPFVMVHGRSNDANCSYIDTDSVSGTNDVLEHLVRLGHKRIGFACGRIKEYNARERLDTYRHFMSSRGMPTDEDLIAQGDWSLESGYEAFNALCSGKKPPTAILFSNDQMAIGGIKAAHDRGVAIPEEISIAGFDDITYASFVTPALTTIRQSMDEIARTAVDLLLDRIAHGEAYRKIILKTELIARDSTGEARR